MEFKKYNTSKHKNISTLYLQSYVKYCIMVLLTLFDEHDNLMIKR